MEAITNAAHKVQDGIIYAKDGVVNSTVSGVGYVKNGVLYVKDSTINTTIAAAHGVRDGAVYAKDTVVNTTYNAAGAVKGGAVYVKDGVVHTAVAGKDWVAAKFNGVVHYVRGDVTPADAAEAVPEAKQVEQ